MNTDELVIPFQDIALLAKFLRCIKHLVIEEDKIKEYNKVKNQENSDSYCHSVNVECLQWEHAEKPNQNVHLLPD